MGVLSSLILLYVELRRESSVCQISHAGSAKRGRAEHASLHTDKWGLYPPLWGNTGEGQNLVDSAVFLLVFQLLAPSLSLPLDVGVASRSGSLSFPLSLLQAILWHAVAAVGRCLFLVLVVAFKYRL